MRMTHWLAALGCALVAHPLDVVGQANHAATNPRRAHAGTTRFYYIASDEVDWTYTPARGDRALTGAKDTFEKDPISRGVLDPNGTTYRKVLFREYTDSSFRSQKPSDDRWKHLGILGPLIRAEVGDTIKVIFRNNASRSYSIHPHGVFYKKDSEGAPYLDGTAGADKRDDAVPPHGTHTYTWGVPERAGPADGDVSTAFWLYHSHVDEGKDINSGLIGPMIITRQGMARADGSPKDVDREFVANYGIFDETLSWLWDVNVKRIYGDATKYDSKVKGMQEFHHFFAINGYLEGNGPLFTMREGERVRWYLFANPNEQNASDVHTPHWHGQTAVVGHMRTDMIMLTPMMTAVADMVPDNPGVWLFHCHMPGHFAAGMYTRFNVLPATK